MMRIAVALLAVLAIGQAEARLSNAYWNTHGQGVVQNGTQSGKVATWLKGDTPLDVYIAEPANAKPTAAVVIFTDIYGFEFSNTRLWADRLAKKGGFLVVIPDFFRGDALTDATRNTSAVWRTRHPKDRVLKDFTAVLAELKKAYPSVKKIGQQGFCWGGGYSVWLSAAGAPKIAAAVGYHISAVTAADIDAITGPISLQQSDPALDNSVNETLYAYIEKTFKAKRAKGIPAYTTFYKGFPHGFSLRGNLSDPAYAKAASTAFYEGVKFLKARLLPPTDPISRVIAVKTSLIKSAQGVVAQVVAAPKPAAPKAAAPKAEAAAPKAEAAAPKAAPAAPKAAAAEAEAAPATKP